MNKGVEPEFSFEEEHLANKILSDSFNENPSLEVIERAKLLGVINLALNEINVLEEAARHPVFPNTSLEAGRIKTIWCFSGPGTYDLPFKEDRYKDKIWAEFMDRRRLNYAAFLMRKITQIHSGNQLQDNKDPQKMRAAILKYSPYLIYNGRKDENETVRDVLGRKGIIIPEEKVHIINAAIDKSIDQIRTFNLPPSLSLKQGDRIALVSHAPHLMRVLHMIEKVKPIQEGVGIQVFPVPTRSAGRQEYSEMEVRGLLYATFIAGEAAETAYPYLL